MKPIEHILLVEGVSGAGKSTFIGELTSGRIPETIESLLPRGARQWDVSDSSRLADWLTRQTHNSCTHPSAVTLHCDLTHHIRRGESFYGKDQFQLHLAGRVTVIRIRPSVERLIQQLAYRYWGSGVVRKLWLTVLLPRYRAMQARHWARLEVMADNEERRFTAFLKSRGLLTGWRALLARKRVNAEMLVGRAQAAPHAQAMIERYAKQDELAWLYRSWDDYLQSVRISGIRIDVLTLVPSTSLRDRKPSWSLVETPARLEAVAGG